MNQSDKKLLKQVKRNAKLYKASPRLHGYVTAKKLERANRQLLKAFGVTK